MAAETLNFRNLAISRIHNMKVYEYDSRNDLYIEIVYETQDGHTEKVIFGDAGLNINDTRTKEIFTSLIVVIYYIFDELDRREEFYSAMYRGGFEVFRRGYYYLALRSINTGYIINISLGSHLKHMLKLDDSSIVKMEYSTDNLMYWDEIANGYVALPSSYMKFHVGYKFNHKLLWDPQFELTRTWNLNITAGKIGSKDFRYGVLFEKVGLFIPIENPSMSILNSLSTHMNNYPLVDFNVILYHDPDLLIDFNSSAAAKIREMSKQYSNFRLFCTISGLKSNGDYKTFEELKGALEPWESLFSHADPEPSYYGAEESINHISGYILENIIDYSMLEGGVIDPNEQPDIRARYGALRSHLYAKGQYIGFKKNVIPVQWFGMTDTPMDFAWQYNGDKLNILDENEYGLSYLHKRKAITILNEIAPRLDEHFLDRLLGHSHMLYISNRNSFEQLSSYIDELCEFIMKRNQLLLNKVKYVDNQPMTGAELTRQNAHVDGLGLEYRNVTDGLGTYNMLVKK